MMKNNLYPVSKEGWLYIGYSVALFVLLGLLDLEFLQFFSFILILVLVYIYRNPERQIMALEKGGVVSPVDGKVIDIKENKDCVEIVVESSYSDVSVLRVPINSSAKSIKYVNGASLGSSSSKSDKLNERLDIELEDQNKNIVKVSHISRLNFSKISHDMIESQRLIQGFRYGLMLKGTTKITLNNAKKIDVNIGDEIRGCDTIIAYL